MNTENPSSQTGITYLHSYRGDFFVVISFILLFISSFKCFSKVLISYMCIVVTHVNIIKMQGSYIFHFIALKPEI